MHTSENATMHTPLNCTGRGCYMLLHELITLFLLVSLEEDVMDGVPLPGWQAWRTYCHPLSPDYEDPECTLTSSLCIVVNKCVNTLNVLLLWCNIWAGRASIWGGMTKDAIIPAGKLETKLKKYDTSLCRRYNKGCQSYRITNTG